MQDHPDVPAGGASTGPFGRPPTATAAFHLDLGDQPGQAAVKADAGRASDPTTVVLRVAIPAPAPGGQRGGVRLSIAGSPPVMLALVEAAANAVRLAHPQQEGGR
jgi:hypothetical protein